MYKNVLEITGKLLCIFTGNNQLIQIACFALPPTVIVFTIWITVQFVSCSALFLLCSKYNMKYPSNMPLSTMIEKGSCK